MGRDGLQLPRQRGDPAEARRLLTQSRDAFTRIGMTQKVKQLQDLLDGLPAEA